MTSVVLSIGKNSPIHFGSIGEAPALKATECRNRRVWLSADGRDAFNGHHHEVVGVKSSHHVV